MNQRVARKKLHLATAGLACLAPGAAQPRAQVLHATGPLPSFEAATIKPAIEGRAVLSVGTPGESRRHQQHREAVGKLTAT